MKHLLKLLDLSKEEIIDILNLADQLKYETKHGIEHHHLKGKCLAMIFEKSSTRTRVSLKWASISSAAMPLYSRAKARRSVAASRCRTPHACFPAMWTAS